MMGRARPGGGHNDRGLAATTATHRLPPRTRRLSWCERVPMLYGSPPGHVTELCTASGRADRRSDLPAATVSLPGFDGHPRSVRVAAWIYPRALPAVADA